MTRTELLLRITRRLIILTFYALAVVVGIFSVTFLLQKKLMISWLCFACGLLGGFVSIQQRLKKISDEELDLLAHDSNLWWHLRRRSFMSDF